MAELHVKESKHDGAHYHAVSDAKGKRLSGDGGLPRRGFISSVETYPTIAEAMTAAALKLLEMTERLEALDKADERPRI